MDPERPPRRMSRPQRKASLLDVAARLVDEGGVGALTFEAMADAADVAKTLPYAYFESRDEVLVTLFDRVVGAIDERVEAVATSGGDLETILRDALAVWFDAVRDEGRLLQSLLDGRSVPGLREAVRRRDSASHKLWHDVVVAHLGLADHQAHVLAAVMNQGATGTVELWVRRRGSRRDLVDAFVTAVLGAADGLRAAAAAR